MKTTREFKITTGEHGYALEIGEKGWLLEDEQQLAEANTCKNPQILAYLRTSDRLLIKLQTSRGALLRHLTIV